MHLLGAAYFAEQVGMPDETIVSDVRQLQGERRSLASLLIVRGREKRKAFILTNNDAEIPVYQSAIIKGR